jgi:glyoxylase I family protein
MRQTLFNLEEYSMGTHIQTGAVHHLTLTVTDLGRAEAFYTGTLGFQKLMDLTETRILVANGGAIMALSEAPDPSQAIPNDRFNENRVGLDHLSLSVGSRDDLEKAVELFDQQGIQHGEIKDLGEGLKLYVLAFRDPDNIQLELAAPYAE